MYIRQLLEPKLCMIGRLTLQALNFQKTTFSNLLKIQRKYQVLFILINVKINKIKQNNNCLLQR